MPKLKGLITFFVSLVIVLNGCGRPTPGYKIYRDNDILLVFFALNDKSKIVDTTLDNNELIADIKTGEEIRQRKISLERSYMGQLISPEETVEIHGTDRIKGYGIVHCTVTSPNPRRFSMSFTWSGLRGEGLSKNLGRFGSSGSFRIDDKMIAYCMIPEIEKSSLEFSKFGITVEFTDTTTFENEKIDVDGNRILEIEYGDSDMHTQNFRFLLKGILPNETVEVEDRKKLGKDIVIAKLKVFPKKSLPTKKVNLTDR
ncbi:hypothetical protein F4212_05045 [Candidatus Poribacteria bacterium]|nr:hypothetical protein [Candidatus Poribacteria bacterium]